MIISRTIFLIKKGCITQNKRSIMRTSVLFLEGKTMFDYSKCMNRMIFCIDLCSFFASCACVMRGLDVRSTESKISCRWGCE